MTTESRPFLTIGEAGPRDSRQTRDGLRLYTWPGPPERELPSVTTIRRMAGIPHRLHQWSISQVIDRALDDWAGLSSQLRTGTPTSLEAVRLHLRKAATDERDRKAALGTAVHDAAARGAALTDVEPEVAPFLRQYLDWLGRSGCTPLLVERQVWSLSVGYAGTFDLLASFPDGSVWLIDIKTGSGIYSDHALQLAAYRYADFIGNAGVIDQGATSVLREVVGTAVLHLSQRKWEFVSIRTGPEEWRAFRGLVAFAMWDHEHPEVEDLALGMRKGAA